VQAGPDALYCQGRCPELELTQGLAVIRATCIAKPARPWGQQSAAGGGGCPPPPVGAFRRRSARSAAAPDGQIGRTSSAWGPLGPWVAVNSIRWLSWRLR
jgi:hypothetical protein